MLQVVQDPVHLIEFTLGVFMLDAQLVAVGLADGAVLIRPLVPDMAAQFGNPVGLFLPDPQDFVNGTLPIGAAQGHNGEFLRQIIAVYHTEFLDGMGRSAVSPAGTNLQCLIGKAVFQNVQACCSVNFICSAHKAHLLIIFI